MKDVKSYYKNRNNSFIFSNKYEMNKSAKLFYEMFEKDKKYNNDYKL